MPHALHALDAVLDLPRFGRVASTGLVPDWIAIDKAGLFTAAENGRLYGYDATQR